MSAVVSGRLGLLLALFPVLGPRAALAGEGAPQRRGPIERRDAWLLAQTRLTLPATSPDTLPPGTTRVRVSLDWGNDFGWQAGIRRRGELSYLVDGEHGRLEVEASRGLAEGLEVGVRAPLLWRGGGVLDGVIDAWHGVTAPLGVPDNGRAGFATRQLRVVGLDRNGRPLSWTGRPGVGFGRLELEARRALGGAGRLDAAAAGRVALPTGTGPFADRGVEAGLQLVAAASLGARWDLYAGAGGTASPGGGAIAYARHRAHGFAALEWRPARALSLLAEATVASRLVTNVSDYPGLASYLRIGAKLDVGRRLRLEGGFTENLLHQQATTDFGVFFGFATR
jgi:hypothetical protein